MSRDEGANDVVLTSVEQKIAEVAAERALAKYEESHRCRFDDGEALLVHASKRHLSEDDIIALGWFVRWLQNGCQWAGKMIFIAIMVGIVTSVIMAYKFKIHTGG